MQRLKFAGVIFWCASAVWGQTAVEYSVGTAASSSAAAGASGAGRAIGGVFGSLGKVLGQAADKSSQAPATATGATSTPSAKPVQSPRIEFKPVDPALVSAGMTRAEVISRCGEPPSSTTANSVETLSYETANHDILDVKLLNGVVSSSRLTPQKKRAPVALLLQ